MKKKLIKKYQSGGSPRQYNYQPLPPKDKWNGVTSIKDLEGNELSPGDLVMATPEGKMVTPDNTQAYLDYMAANDIPIQGPTLNQITVTHNNQTGKTTTSLGEDFEDRLKRLQQDPIANDSQLKQLWLEQGEQLWNQSHDKHVIDTRAADKTANARTPEALSIMSPALIGIAAILGFESATAMAAWAAAYPEAFTGIVGSTLGGEIINLATNLGSGGKYRDWGDAANQIWGTGETLGGFTNPGYFANPLSKGISTIEQNGKRLLDQTLAKLNGSWAQRALNTATKYGLGEGVKAGIYNTAQSLQYGPEVAAKAGLNHLKFGAQDLGWHISNFIPGRRKHIRSSQRGYYPYDIIQPFNPKAYKPSDRKEAKDIYNTIKGLAAYLDTKEVIPKFNFTIDTRFGPLKVNVDTPIKINSAGTHTDNYVFTFDNIKALKSILNFNPDRSALGRRYPSLEEAQVVKDALLQGKFDQQLSQTIGYNPSFKLIIPGKINFFNSSELKPVDPKVIEVNQSLKGLGHVTGSQITFQNSYSTHTPNDIDIITTYDNLPEVLNIIKAQVNRRYQPGDGHIKVYSNKYGEDIDIQVIEGINNENVSYGRIAQQIYRKLNPNDYISRASSEDFSVPMSPNDLLNAHRKNVLNFANIDQITIDSPKYHDRVPNIYGSSNNNEVIQTIKNLENTYRAILGEKFQTIEEQGVKLDYSDVQNNTQFLIKLGVDPMDAEILAKDPTKMELAVKDFIYSTHIGARQIERQKGMTNEDVFNALHSNSSYDNFGGNHGRRDFGGGREFGGDDGYLIAVQFPIKHIENIKKPLDVYNTIGKYMVSSPVSFPTQAAQLSSDFILSNQIQTQLRNTFNIPKEVDISSLQKVINYTVPGRGKLDIHIGSRDLNTPERKLLETYNNKFADIMDLDFVFSNQKGFNGFLGRYRKTIPKLNYNTIHINNPTWTSFPGFEFPRVSPVVESKGALFELNASNQMKQINNKVHMQYRPTLSNKRDNAKKLIDQYQKQKFDLLYAPDELYDKIKVAASTIGIPGALIGVGSYMWNNSPRTMATDIANKVPEDSYNDASKLIKFLKDNYNVVLDDYEIKDIINQKNLDKQRLTLISHLDSYIRYKKK